MSQEKFAERMRITDQAVRHEEADRIPIWCQYGSTPFVLSDGAATYRDSMYDFEKAADAIIRFHADFQPDAQLANLLEALPGLGVFLLVAVAGPLHHIGERWHGVALSRGGPGRFLEFPSGARRQQSWRLARAGYS